MLACSVILKAAGVASTPYTQQLSQRVDELRVENMSHAQLVELIANTAAADLTSESDNVAVRVTTWHMRRDHLTFSQSVDALHSCVHGAEDAPRVSEAFYTCVSNNAAALDAMVCIERDHLLTHFGLCTLRRAYLLTGVTRDGARVTETVQHMWLRVAVGIHMQQILPDLVELDLERVKETYDLMSKLVMTHATPTLFNAGTPLPQMSSCFLLTMQDDSIRGIFKTLSDVALISKNAGGIGLAISDIRAAGSYIKGTGGTSNGIVPMLKVFNDCARYVDQGGGKRRGSFAVYLEPWHKDVRAFLELKLPQGNEEERCRDLFLALWIPDIFMRRVRDDADWTLFCPTDVPGMTDQFTSTHGAAFDELYVACEQTGVGVRVRARDIWTRILRSQIETGVPYMLYKDAANRKSNQNHLGTIRCSNLCTEIIQYTSPDETAVCNLASISLKQFVRGDRTFDHAALAACARVCVYNLNRVIDNNYYPVQEAENSNKRHRPIGLGVQGLADALCMMGIAYDSSEAVRVDREIFETIYYAAVSESCDLAKRVQPYETFAGSPASRGLLQYDLWDQTERVQADSRYDWSVLKERVFKHGLRNSLLVAPMPTASTSQILGSHVESFSPLPSVCYQRRTLAGDHIVMMPAFVEACEQAGIWNDNLKRHIFIYIQV